jgi:hypothetical protein
MNYVLFFLPQVESDTIAGYRWYEDKASGLGEDFLRIFYAQVQEIIRNPLLFPLINQDIRRCLLRRFPYAIYFKTENWRIIILGLFHCARNPESIKTTLKIRNP